MEKVKAKKPVDKRKTAILISAIAGVLAIIIAVVMIFSFVAGKGYEVKIYKNEAGEEQVTSIDVYATVSQNVAQQVSEVWICLADLKVSSLTVYVSSGTDTDEYSQGSSTKLLKTTTVTRSKLNGDGWVRVYKGSDFPHDRRPQIKIGFTAPVTVKEIAVVDTQNKLASLKITGVSVGKAPTTSGTNMLDSKNYTSYQANENKDIVKGLELLTDEQDKFNHFPEEN